MRERRIALLEMRDPRLIEANAGARRVERGFFHKPSEGGNQPRPRVALAPLVTISRRPGDLNEFASSGSGNQEAP